MRLQVGKGMDEYLQKLGNLEFKAEGTVKRAVYEGAKVVADAVKKNLDSLPTSDGYQDRITAPKTIQKKGLIDGFGISKMKNQGGYEHVKLGFHGYNGMKTKKYPRGQPNVMIARVFEGGTSNTKRHPFVSPAVRATKEAAEARMQKSIDENINKIMN